MVTYQAQYKPVDSNDIVFPYDVINGVDAFVDVPSSRVRHLEYQIVAEFPKVR